MEIIESNWQELLGVVLAFVISYFVFFYKDEKKKR